MPFNIKHILFSLSGGLVAFFIHMLNLQATKQVDHSYQYAGSVLAGSVIAFFIARTHKGWQKRTRDLEEANLKLQAQMEELQQAEKALRLSEERYRDLFDSSADLIQIISPDGKLLYANKCWQETMGVNKDEVSGLLLFEVIAPEQHSHCQDRFSRLMAGEDVGKIETEFVSRDGKKILVEGNCSCRIEDGKPVSIRGIFRDVTESRQMQDELEKAKRLESIGILAGGIAHDFNNILSGLGAVLSLVKASLPKGDKHVEILDEAQLTCLQGRELTSKFLTFAEGGSPFRKCVSITYLLKKTVEIALSGSQLQPVFSIPDDLWKVNVDEGQMQQVVNNLVINAREAMHEKGVLQVKAENTTFTAVEGFVLEPGKYIRISFTDQGVGIPPEIISKIFDPYFTTKNMASDRGMGFGLTICYSIIKKHEGLITVESQKGVGTSFHIFLPTC